MANQTIRLIEFHNRVATFKMKGTYGYVGKDLKDSGGFLLTAESYVEELEVTGTKVLDDNGDRIPSPLIIGIDKYGREMKLPIDRILAVGFDDTKEQAKLKGLKYLIETYSRIPNLETVAPSMAEDYKNFIEEHDELVSNGVTLYQRSDV